MLVILFHSLTQRMAVCLTVATVEPSSLQMAYWLRQIPPKTSRSNRWMQSVLRTSFALAVVRLSSPQLDITLFSMNIRLPLVLKWVGKRMRLAPDVTLQLTLKSPRQDTLTRIQLQNLLVQIRDILHILVTVANTTLTLTLMQEDITTVSGFLRQIPDVKLTVLQDITIAMLVDVTFQEIIMNFMTSLSTQQDTTLYVARLQHRLRSVLTDIVTTLNLARMAGTILQTITPALTATQSFTLTLTPLLKLQYAQQVTMIVKML